MGGFGYGGSLQLKVDETKRKIYEDDVLGMADYPFKEPKVFLEGYGEECIPQICSSWSSDGIVLVRDNTVIEYTQIDFMEGLIRAKNGDTVWGSMCHIFADEDAEGELLNEYRDAQRYLVTEYDLKTLTKTKYKVVLDESSEFDELDFYRLGEFLEGEIIDDYYVVNNGVLKRCVGVSENLVIPDLVVKIDESLLCGHLHFKNILIPKKLVDIPDAFFKNYSAECVVVAEDNPRYYVENGCLIDRYTSTLVWAFDGNYIPDDGTITKIGSYAFCKCADFESIVIPDTITEIGGGAFKGCFALQEIQIPNAFVAQAKDIFGYDIMKNGDKWEIVKEKNPFLDGFSF